MHLNLGSQGTRDVMSKSESDSDSLLVEYGSRLNSPRVFDDAPDLQSLQNPIGVPFHVCAQQLGSHLVCLTDQDEALAMSLELGLGKVDAAF